MWDKYTDTLSTVHFSTSALFVSIYSFAVTHFAPLLTTTTNHPIPSHPMMFLSLHQDPTPPPLHTLPHHHYYYYLVGGWLGVSPLSPLACMYREFTHHTHQPHLGFLFYTNFIGYQCCDVQILCTLQCCEGFGTCRILGEGHMNALCMCNQWALTLH